MKNDASAVGKPLRCQDCVHDKGKCVGSSRKGRHAGCFEPKPKTNGEKIRDMSDEELADQLVIQVEGLEPCSIYLSAPTGKMFISRTEATRITLEWLGQLAKEG